MGVNVSKVIKSDNGKQHVTKIRDAFYASMTRFVEERKDLMEARQIVPTISPATFPGIQTTTSLVEIPKLGYTIKEVKRTYEKGKQLPRIIFGKEYIQARLLWFGAEICIDRNMKDYIANSEILPTSLTDPVVMEIARDQNDFLMNGDTVLGLKGLNGVVGLRTFVVKAGAGGTTEWATKTGREIVEDLLEAEKEFKDSKKYRVTTIAMHPELYYLMKVKRIGAFENSETALEDAMKQFPNVRFVENVDLVDANQVPTVVLLEEDPSNYGVIETSTIQNTMDYMDLTDEISIFEGKLSEVIGFHPEAIMFLEGVY